MNKGVNKITLIGNVGQDPKIFTTDIGHKVGQVSLATSEYWVDKTSGQKQSHTEWHRLVFFGKLADLIEQYVKKGTILYACGPKKTKKYADKTGIEREICEIIVKEFQILNKKDDDKIKDKSSEEILENEFNF